VRRGFGLNIAPDNRLLIADKTSNPALSALSTPMLAGMSIASTGMPVNEDCGPPDC
jgi:hypothetical protein